MNSESRVQPLRSSQRERIADLLQLAYPGEVPALELAQESLQYSARVKELRDAGWDIRNRVEIVGSRKFGYFRLVHKPSASPTMPPTPLPLFPTGGVQ